MSTSVSPPAFSDGIGEEAWPSLVVRIGQPTPQSSSSDIYHREVAPQENIHRRWLAKAGSAVETNATLSHLPNGYHLLQQLKEGHEDLHLYGHPSGKEFRSVDEFIPHLRWLIEDDTHDQTNCECLVCSYPGGTSSRKSPKRKLNETEPVLTPNGPPDIKGKRGQKQARVVIVVDDVSPPLRVTPPNPTAVIEISDDESTPTPLEQQQQRPASTSNGLSLQNPAPEPVGLVKSGAGGTLLSKPPDGECMTYETPTFWEGRFRYKDTSIEAIALRLHVGEDDTIISPRDSYWAPCPLFASFPLEFRLENGVAADVAEQMTQTAKRYVNMSMRHSPILWAYHVLVLPSFQPESNTKEENARTFEKLKKAMKAGKWAAFVKQDKVQFVLRPTGHYFTGYAMLEDAIKGWSNDRETPIEIEI